jgi:hypothetical protein
MLTKLAVWWLCKELKNDRGYWESWKANIAMAFWDEWKVKSPTLATIQGAVARGWCYPENEQKVMDTDLANAIACEVLNEFFDLTPDGYRSSRADKEIEHYHSKIQQASRAGKASAERRMNGRSTVASTDVGTDVQLNNKQETLNKNQEPVTKNQKTKTQISVEPQSVSQPVVEVPILGGKVYGVSQEMVAEWSKAYPAVDVQAELQKMRVWAMSNPNMQKTSTGIPRFVNAWLSKAQNEAGKVPSGSFKNAGDRNAEVIRGLTRGLLGSGNNVKLLGN